MSIISQYGIDCLDKLAKEYNCEVLLPPVNGSYNVFLYLYNTLGKAELQKNLFYMGFSFDSRTINNKSYIEIKGMSQRK